MPDDAPVVLVADHVAGLREAIDWCETHPAFAAMLTHTTVSAHIDDPVMFAAALRQFDAAAPLAPHDRRLRLHRYEVAAYGPARQPGNRRSLVAGPFRFATELEARAYATDLRPDGVALIVIDYIRPAAPRYGGAGPWRTDRIAGIEVSS